MNPPTGWSYPTTGSLCLPAPAHPHLLLPRFLGDLSPQPSDDPPIAWEYPWTVQLTGSDPTKTWDFLGSCDVDDCEETGRYSHKHVHYLQLQTARADSAARGRHQVM